MGEIQILANSSESNRKKGCIYRNREKKLILEEEGITKCISPLFFLFYPHFETQWSILLLLFPKRPWVYFPLLAFKSFLISHPRMKESDRSIFLKKKGREVFFRFDEKGRQRGKSFSFLPLLASQDSRFVWKSWKWREGRGERAFSLSSQQEKLSDDGNSTKSYFREPCEAQKDKMGTILLGNQVPFITSVVSKVFYLLGAHMGHPRHHFKTRRKNEDREEQFSKKSLVLRGRKGGSLCGERKEKKSFLDSQNGERGRGRLLNSRSLCFPQKRKERK